MLCLDCVISVMDGGIWQRFFFFDKNLIALLSWGRGMVQNISKCTYILSAIDCRTVKRTITPSTIIKVLLKSKSIHTWTSNWITPWFYLNNYKFCMHVFAPLRVLLEGWHCEVCLESVCLFISRMGGTADPKAETVSPFFYFLGSV